MNKSLIALAALCAGLAVPPPPAHADLLSAKRAVVAILADDLFIGEAEGHLDGAGTLAIRSQRQRDLTCLGQFTSSAEQGGVGQLQCSDGTRATFQFRRLGVFRGYGVASFSRGAMSFAYGFAPEEAGTYLKLPTGKKLIHNGTELALADM